MLKLQTERNRLVIMLNASSLNRKKLIHTFKRIMSITKPINIVSHE